VLSQNSILPKSSRIAMIEVEQSAQLLTPPDRVLSQNSIRRKSSGIAMIEVEQSAQPFTALDRPDRMIVLPRREQPVAKPLMIPLQVVSASHTPAPRAAGVAHPVLSQNSIGHKSSRIAMIEVEQSTQPFTPTDGADGMIVLLRREQPVAEPLMIPLQVVVRHILCERLQCTPRSGGSTSGIDSGTHADARCSSARLA
jgi:hypothetical protein